MMVWVGKVEAAAAAVGGRGAFAGLAVFGSSPTLNLAANTYLTPIFGHAGKSSLGLGAWISLRTVCFDLNFIQEDVTPTDLSLTPRPTAHKNIHNVSKKMNFYAGEIISFMDIAEKDFVDNYPRRFLTSMKYPDAEDPFRTEDYCGFMPYTPSVAAVRRRL
ncbi:hypothetical protein Hamer_G016165 [Homarus americanus]|uniref:Uncharacterized protein n=1 Tax=Homarus americanus TaxID=6706 RepID=A0A8J5KMB8_HOMAM|nr:hypothetical protein Hamer_G016165 [Homarus americanus]